MEAMSASRSRLWAVSRRGCPRLSASPFRYQERRSSARRRSLLRSEPLAAGAIMGAALRQNDTLDDSSAAQAWLAFALVHPYMVVVIARLAPEVTIIVERCTAMLYAQGERLHNGVMQRLHFGGRELIGAAQWMDAGAEERFIRVDVANARDYALIQQHLLDLAPAPCQRLAQTPGGELWTQRLRPQSRQCLALSLARPQSDASKLAWIGEKQAPPITQGKADAAILRLVNAGWNGPRCIKRRPSRVPGQRIALPQAAIDPPRAGKQQEIARHAPVNGEHEIPAQIEDEKFAAPAHLFDAPRGNPGEKSGQVRIAHGPRPEHVGPLDRCADDAGTQLARRIFHFR